MNILEMPRPQYRDANPRLRPRHRETAQERKIKQDFKVQQQIHKSYPPPKVSLLQRCSYVIYGYTCHMVASATSESRGCWVQPMTASFVGGFVYGATCLAIKLAVPTVDNLTLFSSPVIAGIAAMGTTLAIMKLVSPSLHDKAMRWCYFHAISQIKDTGWLSALKNECGKQLVKDYTAEFYERIHPERLSKNTNLDDLSDDIAELIESVAESNKKWSKMSTGQQRECVSQRLSEELERSVFQCQECACKHSHTSGIYRRLMDKIYENYGDSKDLEGYEHLQYTSAALVKLMKSNDKAFWLVKYINYFMYGVPSSAILINLIYNEVVDPAIHDSKRWEGEENKRRYSKISSIMHAAVIRYLSRKIGAGQNESTQVLDEEKFTLSSATSALQQNPVKARKRRQKKQSVETNTVQRTQAARVIKLSESVKESIRTLGDHAGRSKFISKCIERIQNCGSWNDLRMLQSCDGNLSIAMPGVESKLPVYHKSAGVMGDKGYRKATVFFTCVDNSVVPIALAEHVGQGSAEYRVIKCCEGWEIPKGRIRLNESMVIKKF